MERPTVTVLLPAHGSAPFLGPAITSTLAAATPETDVLVVDDRLEESVRKWLEELRDPRVGIVAAGGIGLVAALNTGLADARGRYIARMDADDVMMPDRLIEQIAFLETHPDIAAVGGQLQVIGLDGVPAGQRRYPTATHAVRRAMRQRNVLAHPAACMRTDLVRRVGGYRAGFPGAEDYDLWLRLLEHGELANLESVVLRYRVHPGQVTQSPVQTAESTYLAQWAARRRHSGKADAPLPWAADAPLAPQALRWRVARARVRASARLFGKARSALQRRNWAAALAASLAWAMLRPAYAFAQILRLREWAKAVRGQ